MDRHNDKDYISTQHSLYAMGWGDVQKIFLRQSKVLGQIKYGDTVYDRPRIVNHMDIVHHSRYLWHRNWKRGEEFNFLYTPTHDNDGVLCYHVGRPYV